jgi:hypothetical protein
MGNAGYGNSTEDTQAEVDSKRTDAKIDNLPSNATQPGGAPQERGDRNAGAPEPSDRLPPAGPHADPKLMNPDATPGTGALTPTGGHDDVDSTSS